MRRHRVDASWWRRRTEKGDIVVAGSPLRMFRFSPAARPALDALEMAAPTHPDADAVVSRLVEAGAVHPIPDATDPTTTSRDVTVVIPAHDEPTDRLQLLVASLSLAHRIIVVDDASNPPVPAITGAQIIRRDTAGGPAAARNTGLAAVDSPLVLLLDADTEFDPLMWPRLLAHFDDESVAIVAPRITCSDRRGLLARYERSDSPLDLGTDPARIAPNTRVSYAPTAGLMVRTVMFERHGRFDESLRYGEDVDFVWRLCAAGETLRYEPSATIGHRPRATLGDAFRQRVSYGSAAAPLETRHPGSAAPLRLNRWTAAAWSAGGAGHPFIALAIAAASTARLAKRLAANGDRTDAAVVAMRLAGRGNLFAGRLIAATMWRTWWPITLTASLISRRARRIAVVALIIPNLIRWWEHRRAGRTDLDPVSYSTLRIADDVAYGTGVWKGVLTARDARVLRPRLD